MKLCDFGCSQSAVKQFKSGKYCCSNSASGCPAMKKKNSAGVKAKRKELGDNYWTNGHPKGATGGTSLKGKTFEEIYGERADNEKKKRSASLLGHKGYDKLTPEEKLEHANRARKQALERHANGWNNKAGRCKKYSYSSPIAGDITVDGTWELAVAKWLDAQQYNWKRNTKRFQYTNLKNVTSHYTPDFWVEELNGYLEVKGYETELDRCKWQQFTENLTVWKKKDLQNLKLV
jgi:hypothetical protein